ncbi:MAG: dynamin family protein [Gammaproteobacteria bacterium]|nr:dynamin family protein [Gammaproteobacteria bacterium]NIR84146.1 dynamin family protein [Gammaproteobacteria bacterium]NIR89458.1 dynamin family protein [Gammaproteobacteria bacterium]NIU05301.1 dynamin family protein [Gammaproteobacteria bacterium]NIV52241.1 dynamin family protein [Gammaproteobacteria bacterium]
MQEATPLTIEERLHRLETHLQQENPILAQAVKSFRRLDRVAYRLGLLHRSESFATKVSWWPAIAALGTFSSGKSTFINQYVGQRLQLTGNQAVDDKFTVICFGSEAEPRVLPGLALDSDPRFPFYQISRDIEDVASGEGRRLDSYLQLKTCNSEKLRGKIFIDSPGFDADAQRTSTLRITDHIIDLSDLVLVFFDARHPEPGAMHDTLEHLVEDTIKRPDSTKFLYILNQIDNTAREDNPEEVFAAWQRALAQKGLTAGRFYRIYDPDAAVPIEDEERRKRFEYKREIDIKEIYGRIHQVEVERAYRVIGVLEKTVKLIRDELVPRIRTAKASWKRRVLWLDGIVFGLILALLLVWSIYADYWQGLRFAPPWLETLVNNPVLGWGVLAIVVVLALYLHFLVRKTAARLVVARLKRDSSLGDTRQWIVRAFLKNARPWRSAIFTKPVGWGRRSRKQLGRILADADRFVQNLNDRFTNPSGTPREGEETPGPSRKPPVEVAPAEAARETLELERQTRPSRPMAAEK